MVLMVTDVANGECICISEHPHKALNGRCFDAHDQQQGQLVCWCTQRARM